MKALLDNRFAPITFRWGFVESPFTDFSRAFIEWQKQIDGKFGIHSEYKSLCAPLSESLFELEPLISPSDRYLLTETRSDWSAIFSNGLRTNDVFSPVSHLPTVLNCRGLEIGSAPDRSRHAGKDGLQIYGHVFFALYGPKETDWLNRIRSIRISNDVGGWEFAADGEIQPYEQIENYKKRRIVDRFTPEMLESYCAALGIDVFNADFYGGQSLSIYTRTKNSSGEGMSIVEAGPHVYLP